MMYKILMSAIWDSIHLFKTNLIALTSIILPFACVIETFDAYYIAKYISDKPLIDDMIPILVLHLLLQPFYSVAIIFYLSSVIAKQPISILHAWMLSIKYWPRYLLLNLLLSVFVFSGLLLFFIPGIFLFIRFSFAEFHLLLEQQQPYDAIKQSLYDTKDYFLVLFSGFLILGISTYGPFFMLKDLIGENEHEMNLLGIMLSIAFDILTIVFTVFAFRVYHLSKEAKSTVQ